MNGVLAIVTVLLVTVLLFDNDNNKPQPIWAGRPDEE